MVSTAAVLVAAVIAVAPVPPPHVAPGPVAGLRQETACVTPSAEHGPGGGLALAEVHALARGHGVRVAVIDTGVAEHPRLAGRLTGGGDYLTGADGLDDCDGHGTAVAGLLAAAAGDDDVVGAAPDAEVVAIRHASPSYSVPGPRGERRPAGDTDTLAAALDHAVALGVSVAVVSETVCLDRQRARSVGRPVREALRRALAADVLVVAAAGNVGSGDCTGAPGEVALPAGADPGAGPGPLSDGVLGVGAATPDDAAAPFSLRGSWVDLAARGTGLRSLAPGGGLTGPDLQGTSMAAPIVAGAAALLRERHPELTAAEVAERLAETARRAPGGRSDALGHGVVDPLAALTALPPPAAARGLPTPDLVPDARRAPDVRSGGGPVATPGVVPDRGPGPESIGKPGSGVPHLHAPVVGLLLALLAAPLPLMVARLRRRP